MSAINEIRGAVVDGNGVVACEKCGGKELRMVAHFDGREVYGNTYNCSCGNVITITYNRDRRSTRYWDVK